MRYTRAVEKLRRLVPRSGSGPKTGPTPKRSARLPGGAFRNYRSELPRLTPSPAEEGLQARDELDAALRNLREVRDRYRDDDWRRDHRGGGRYPEHELWDAVYGYLDLLDASVSAKADSP